MENKEKKTDTDLDVLYKGIRRIVVETDEKDPITVAVITEDEVSAASGYRIRLLPKYY